MKRVAKWSAPQATHCGILRTRITIIQLSSAKHLQSTNRSQTFIITIRRALLLFLTVCALLPSYGISWVCKSTYFGWLCIEQRHLLVIGTWVSTHGEFVMKQMLRSEESNPYAVLFWIRNTVLLTWIIFCLTSEFIFLISAHRKQAELQVAEISSSSSCQDALCCSGYRHRAAVSEELNSPFFSSFATLSTLFSRAWFSEVLSVYYAPVCLFGMKVSHVCFN